MSEAPTKPRLAAQTGGVPAIAVEEGGHAWLWYRGEVHLVRVVRTAWFSGRDGTQLPGAVIVVDGQVRKAPLDRLTALPEIDPDPCSVARP